ncbi:type VII secretion target [Rhodococcus marinonascens]|uniref:type VII secretion target n=1 Tax=Rhodococcus marinonascens TaxID=38311 RepID=UPI000A01589F|nr:type VII secretion target [Rhodococcus marinonascens]
MNELIADTASITEFAATTSAMSAEVRAAELGASAVGPLLLGPVFGVIGGEFVAAFSAAHAAHLSSIEKLSGVLGGISTTALVNAANYEGIDLATTAALAANAAGLDG